MPNKPALDGKPEDLVYVHFKVPLWLKKRAAVKATDQGQDLTEYFRGLLVADLGARKG